MAIGEWEGAVAPTYSQVAHAAALALPRPTLRPAFTTNAAETMQGFDFGNRIISIRPALPEGTGPAPLDNRGSGGRGGGGGGSSRGCLCCGRGRGGLCC